MIAKLITKFAYVASRDSISVIVLFFEELRVCFVIDIRDCWGVSAIRQDALKLNEEIKVVLIKVGSCMYSSFVLRTLSWSMNMLCALKPRRASTIFTPIKFLALAGD